MRVAAKLAVPLADLVQACIGPAAARQGFSGTDILVSWPDIVGERLAAASQPIRLDWPRRHPGSGASDPAVLVVRVESAFAIDLQHLAPIVVERVNAFYGWRCVGRLVLKQGPVLRRDPGPAPRRALSEADLSRLGTALSGIGPDALRDALQRLGAGILAEPAGTGDREGTSVPQSGD